MTLLALGIGAAAEHQNGAKLFSIPPGPAGLAISEWSRQSGLQVLDDFEVVQHYRTRGIANALTPLDALRAMLRDTPLTYEVVNHTTVAIIIDAPLPPGGQAPQELLANRSLTSTVLTHNKRGIHT